MITRIENTPVEHDWGSLTAIPEILGTRPTGRPQAELWLGAHRASPARVSGSSQTLAEFAPDLPFLLKVLAAEFPLSIQAHPNPAQARAGFEREEHDRVAPSARSFGDPFAKPEMIYALSDRLRALCGFAPIRDVRAALAPATREPSIANLMDRLTGELALPHVVSWILDRSPEVDQLIVALTNEASRLSGEIWETVRTLSAHRPGDIGVAMSILMNTIELRAGEVLDLPAGRIHAYLHGVGIELMGPSDNVLRGGMTSKQIDIDGFLGVLDFHAKRPIPIPHVEIAPGVRGFFPEQGDFALVVVEHADVEVPLTGPAIAFCATGEALLEGQHLTAGDAALLQDQDRVAFKSAGLLFLAIAHLTNTT